MSALEFVPGDPANNTRWSARSVLAGLEDDDSLPLHSLQTWQDLEGLAKRLLSASGFTPEEAARRVPFMQVLAEQGPGAAADRVELSRARAQLLAEVMVAFTIMQGEILASKGDAPATSAEPATVLDVEVVEIA